MYPPWISSWERELGTGLTLRRTSRQGCLICYKTKVKRKARLSLRYLQSRPISQGSKAQVTISCHRWKIWSRKLSKRMHSNRGGASVLFQATTRKAFVRATERVIALPTATVVWSRELEGRGCRNSITLAVPEKVVWPLEAIAIRSLTRRIARQAVRWSEVKPLAVTQRVGHKLPLLLVSSTTLAFPP